MTETNFARSSKTRERLSSLVRKVGPVISVEQTARLLNLPSSKAAMTLSKWAKQGWLKRIKRGFYVPISIEASSSEQVLSNIWVLVPEFFGQAYIGGWSAAEHWGFTEQIFQSICVLTSQKVRQKNIHIQNIPLYVQHIDVSLIFGLKIIWHEKTKIQIADPHKTIIDMLAYPVLGGGIHHVDHCLRAYVESQYYNESKLIEYATKQKNGVIFKRLGYLLSLMDNKKDELINYCREHLTKGISSLEPGYKDIKFITKWGLSVPRNWQEALFRD